jgi:flagellar motility protein MotE (MotC chaperone)
MKPGSYKVMRPIAMPLRLGLLALMCVAVVMIGVRIYDAGYQIAVSDDTETASPLLAAEEVKHEEPKAEEKKAEEKKHEESKPADKHAEAKPEAVKEGEKKDDKTAAAPAEAAPPEVEDPNFETPELTESEINVLRHLSDRRKTLEKRSKELDQRETLLNLSEQRVDKKLVEMKKMQDDIRKILGQADADYKKQVASMVKIYETMKPKDAAKIFGNMDMPTLIEVVSRMKEAKAAPVLAAMDAGKAKELSTQLMARKNLPAAP